MNASYKKASNFVWTDLSSYDTSGATQFYTQTFGWKIYDQGRAAHSGEDRFGMGDVHYHIAMLQNKAAAGIFDMPPFFKTIKMPPFWMSYLTVDHIHDVVARAKQVDGVVVDIEPTPFGDGLMALIRDPLGAGFTVYDGPSIDGKGNGRKQGQLVWNELFTSSIEKVASFYKDVFGLQLVKDSSFVGKRVKVLNGAGEAIAGIQEIDEAFRGEKVYWMPFFSVDSVSGFEKTAVSAGGQLIDKGGNVNGFNTALFYDEEGAAFGVAESNVRQGGKGSASSFLDGLKWKSILAMMLIWTAVFLEWQWIWGFVFLIWILPDLRSGSTFFVENLSRQKNPLAYWLTVSSWLMLSVFLIFA